MVRRIARMGSAVVALGAALLAGGCLETPAESTLAGFLDTRGAYFGEDAGGRELELVCETSDQVLVAPLEEDHFFGSPWPLFEMEIPEGEPTYCYFVERAEPFDLFLGFLGLEPERCEDPHGWDRQWLQWRGDNVWADTISVDGLRTCPLVDLATPEPARTTTVDHCIYCGQTDVTYVLYPDPEDMDADSTFVIYACVGFREILDEEYFALVLTLVDGFPPDLYYQNLTEWPVAMSTRVEQVDGGLGLSSLDFVLAEYMGDLQVEMMFHTDLDADGMLRALSGMVALSSAVPDYEWGIATHTIEPLELPGGECIEPPIEWFEDPTRR